MNAAERRGPEPPQHRHRRPVHMDARMCVPAWHPSSAVRRKSGPAHRTDLLRLIFASSERRVVGAAEESVVSCWNRCRSERSACCTLCLRHASGTPQVLVMCAGSGECGRGGFSLNLKPKPCCGGADAAPEVMTEGEPSLASDMYSFGLVLQEVGSLLAMACIDALQAAHAMWGGA